jgi:uncharacterized protein (TIGR02466 family)
MHNVINLFPTTIWQSELPGWVDKIKEVSLSYYEETLKNQEENIVIQTRNLNNDVSIEFFKKFLEQEAVYFLKSQGYDVNGVELYLRDFWFQQFKKFGRNVSHVHSNCQVSGLYFLNDPNNYFRVVFKDPRNGKVVCDLPVVSADEILPASPEIFFTGMKEGTLILFNSWLTHSIEAGDLITPVDFAHFNVAMRT